MADDLERERDLFRSQAYKWNDEADRYLWQRDELLVAAKLALDVIGNTRDEFGLKLEAGGRPVVHQDQPQQALSKAMPHALVFR